MELSEASKLAVSLMQEHGLYERGWRFEFDFAKRRFGQCNYRRRTIKLSAELSYLNSYEQIRDTVLHEIAHALTPGANHGLAWQLKAAEIGCEPKCCYNREAVTQPERKVIYICDTCGKQIKRFRASAKMTRSACKHCCDLHNKGKFCEQFRLRRIQ